MELVEENNKRWNILISAMLSMVYLMLLFVFEISLLICTIFIILMIVFFILITYARKKTFIVYFSKNSIKFDIDNKKNEFKNRSYS